MDQYRICMEAAWELWKSREDLLAGKRNLLQLMQEIRGELRGESGFRWIEMLEECFRYLDEAEHALGEYATFLDRVAKQHLPAAAILPYLPQTIPCKNEHRSRGRGGILDRLPPLRDEMQREADRFTMIQERSRCALNSLQMLTELPKDIRAEAEMLRQQLQPLQEVKDVLQMGVEKMTQVIKMHRLIEDKSFMGSFRPNEINKKF